MENLMKIMFRFDLLSEEILLILCFEYKLKLSVFYF